MELEQAPSRTAALDDLESVKLQITITRKQSRLLAARARVLAQSKAQVCRDALDAYLAPDERAAKHGIQATIVLRTLPRAIRQIWPRLSD